MNSHQSYFTGRQLFSCLLATCLVFLACHAHGAEKPLNIILLLADDWRFDTLGVAGNPVVQNPNIDKLSAEGVRFTEACVTTPICGVTRSSILSGQWMSRHGNRSFQSMKTPWSQSYPGLLRANGYHVGHVGKWHSGKFPAATGEHEALSGRDDPYPALGEQNRPQEPSILPTGTRK